jgi:hypothetical protein
VEISPENAKILGVLEKKKKVEIIVVDPIFIQLLMDIYIYTPQNTITK